MVRLARVTPDERRARLAVRHRLAPSARTDDDVATVARSVVALHATDPATVVLAAMARMAHPDPAPVDAALYDDRTVVRVMAMRRTMFVVPTEDLPVVHAAASADVAASERKKLGTLLEANGVTTDGARWLRRTTRSALAALGALGEATAADLAEAVPGLATRITLSPGKPYEATVSLASRLVLVLSAEGQVVRTRPRGRWTSTQNRWAPMAGWLGAPVPTLQTGEARTALARAWLARYGPATVADLRWWTGWTLGATRAALRGLELDEVDLDGETGLVLAGDTAPTPVPEPWVALLPSLDPTIMGWMARDWYLAPHRELLFDRNGNAGPTVWADGRAVGAWSQRRDGEIVIHLLQDVGADRSAMIAAEAERVRAAVGDVVVVPRFATPLSRELAG